MCPYHNVPAAAPIPPTLVAVARGDSRVPLWGPLKWVARLRESRRAWDSRAAQVLGPCLTLSPSFMCKPATDDEPNLATRHTVCAEVFTYAALQRPLFVLS